MRLKTTGCDRLAPSFSRHRLLPAAQKPPQSQRRALPEELQYGQQPFGRWRARAPPCLYSGVRHRAPQRSKRPRHVPDLPRLPRTAFAATSVYSTAHQPQMRRSLASNEAPPGSPEFVDFDLSGKEEAVGTLPRRLPLGLCPPLYSFPGFSSAVGAPYLPLFPLCGWGWLRRRRRRQRRRRRRRPRRIQRTTRRPHTLVLGRSAAVVADVAACRHNWRMAAPVGSCPAWR